MRFRTGFVAGCAICLYLTHKVRQLQGPLGRRSPLKASSSQWLGQSGPGLDSADLRAEKVLALGDLARERARDLLRGPVGNLARERVIALFEDAVAAQRAQPSRRTRAS
ncbi:MAG: hypothetical protein ABR972_02270 [Acidimicrobiales bacterium]|jgi:hypothetical protein